MHVKYSLTCSLHFSKGIQRVYMMNDMPEVEQQQLSITAEVLKKTFSHSRVAPGNSVPLTK